MTVTTEPWARYDHYQTSLGRFENRPMAVGGTSPGYHRKVEELRNGVWRTLDDFSFVNQYIIKHSMVNFNEDLYLFGMFLFNQKLAIFNLLFF